MQLCQLTEYKRINLSGKKRAVRLAFKRKYRSLCGRNRRKVESAISNARAFLEIRNEFGSFDSYIWGCVGGVPIASEWGDDSEIPAETPLSKELSKDLRRRGFSFLGPVVCYAHLQATGLVNDHVTACYRWRELSALKRGSVP